MIPKQVFDFSVSLLMVVLISPVLIFIIILAAIDTKSNGIFKQNRVGQYGKLFVIFKIQTIDYDRNISKIGHFLRKSKLDELPQLINVIKGEMSLVGPRPDIPGYYDQLIGDDQKLLQLKPGITGLASLVYRNEEEILALQENPEKYNDEVLFLKKIKLNLLYQENYSFVLDLVIIWHTIFGGLPKIISQSNI